MKHLSSFIGNVGDVFSNFGIEQFLSKKGLSTERLEIRDYYQNVPAPKRKNFQQLFNDCEIQNEPLIIGGGGFLDYWIDSSQTATSIDIDLETLSRTQFPLVIQSVGSYPHKAVTKVCEEKFRNFLTILSERKNTKLILRNDGSFENLDKNGLLIGDIQKGMDNAYLAQQYLDQATRINFDREPYVAINLSKDQLFMLSEYRNSIDFEIFKTQIIDTIRNIINIYKYKVVMIPHLVGDVEFYIELLKGLDDRLVREYIIIAEYNGSVEALNYYYQLYSNSVCNIVTRFHANIFCAMTSVKTISLCILDRVRFIVEQHENLFPVVDFDENLSDSILNIISKGYSKPSSLPYFGSRLEKIYHELFY